MEITTNSVFTKDTDYSSDLQAMPTEMIAAEAHEKIHDRYIRDTSEMCMKACQYY
jgi:hypothetical protein